MRVTEKFRKKYPYHVWVYRRDGSKFIGHFENKKEALHWEKKSKSRLGKVTTASHKHKKRRSSYPNFMNF